jgi:hypothetical protein
MTTSASQPASELFTMVEPPRSKSLQPSAAISQNHACSARINTTSQAKRRIAESGDVTSASAGTYPATGCPTKEPRLVSHV